MINKKPLHLRSDEFNTYIEECKEKYRAVEGDITNEEKRIIHRCGVDYGLTMKIEQGTWNVEQGNRDYNIILRVKGPYTLPLESQFSSEHGPLHVRPYVIHEYGTAQRLKEIAQRLMTEKMVESVVPIDSDYLYEALRESAFNIAMEDVVRLGMGLQIIQVEFDENGHFKAVELDETH